MNQSIRYSDEQRSVYDDEQTSVIANKFLKLGKKEGIPINTFKLVNLMYIAYGYSLSLENRKLFPDPIYAWKYYPVVFPIYQEFKYLGKKPINSLSINLTKYGYKEDVCELYDEIDERIINIVWRLYKKITSERLVKYTSSKGTPWYLTLRDQKIDDDLIKLYYDKIIDNTNKYINERNK